MTSRPCVRPTPDNGYAPPEGDDTRAWQHGAGTTVEADVPVVELCGRPTLDDADALDALLIRAWEHADHGAVICDLTRLRHLSAHAAKRLAQVVTARPPCLAPVLVCAPPGQPASALTAADRGGRLELYPTLAAALADARAGRHTTARSARLGLSREPFGPRSARAFVGTVCETWELAGVVDDAALVTSELVTNAVLHAGGATQLELDLCSDQLTIAVRDAADTAPSPRAADPSGEGGRGLHLVEALTCADGSFRLSEGGKVVWCTLRVMAQN